MNRPQIGKNKNKTQNQSNHTKPNTSPNNAPLQSPANAPSVDQVIEHKKTLQEIKAAAQKLAARDNDGYDWNASYYIELRNQNGQKLVLPDEERQALTVALTLHEKGKKWLKQKRYSEAIDLIKLGFESLSKVSHECIQNIDNDGLMALDIVWSYYLNKDEKNLSNAGQWLHIAEQALKRAHGPNMERLKAIRSRQNMENFIPELSLYVRLNILRSLQSFYINDIESASSYLLSAEITLRKLQINDVDLVKLESMGFNHKESRRALRFCAGNLEAAIAQIYQKRDEMERKRKEEQRRANDRRLQKKYFAGHIQYMTKYCHKHQIQSKHVQRLKFLQVL